MNNYKCPKCGATDESKYEELDCWYCDTKMIAEKDAMDLYKEHRDNCKEQGIINKYE